MDEDENLSGTVIAGRYELQELLGVGATATVYEALHRYTARSVAVKILHPDMMESQSAVQRFMREARAAGAIGHPVIVEVLDAGETSDGRLYIVQELLEGRELSSALEAGGLSIADIIEIGAQILDGLDAAHQQGIVHRDVKPENIFLTRSPAGELLAKLVDFGLAKSPQFSALTMPGTAVGTPYYMSPEQARADPVDGRTDVWSVGAVLFDAATGSPPFDAPDPAQLLTKIVLERAPMIETIRSDLPKAFVRAVNRALEPDPAKRWQTAGAMGRALKGVPG